MVRYHDTLWCDGCGIEISWEPVEQESLFFCCNICLDGDRCRCGEQEEEYPPGIPTPSDINSSLTQ